MKCTVHGLGDNITHRGPQGDAVNLLQMHVSDFCAFAFVLTSVLWLPPRSMYDDEGFRIAVPDDDEEDDDGEAEFGEGSRLQQIAEWLGDGDYLIVFGAWPPPFLSFLALSPAGSFAFSLLAALPAVA